MIKPLLIAKKENAGLLKKISAGLQIEAPRTQIGVGWILERFIESDLKNYSRQTHFILDVSAFTEQGDDFVKFCGILRSEIETARIIIYADEFHAGDVFLHNLIQNGFTNIASNREDSDIFEDFAECFSENGLAREKYSEYIIESVGNTGEEIIAQPPKFTTLYKNITIFGSQDRIGTTTFALSLCEDVINQNGKAALVVCHEKGIEQNRLMFGYFEGEEHDGYFSANGIDIYDFNTFTDGADYDVTVFDCGNIHANHNLLSACSGSDILYLCAGVKWHELEYTVSAQNFLAEHGYTVVVTNGNEEICKKYEEYLCRNLNEYMIGVKYFAECKAHCASSEDN